VTIRRARHGDPLIAVQRAASAVEAELLGYADLPGLRETAEDLAGEELWVAELDGAVIALIGLEGDTIARLAVDPRFARRGLGRALVRHAVACGAVSVGTAAANAPALALYASLGFSPVRSGTVGDGLPYVWLRREA
jgi:ribosomal protein S18 acetylase RimI-like enzyme